MVVVWWSFTRTDDLGQFSVAEGVVDRLNASRLLPVLDVSRQTGLVAVLLEVGLGHDSRHGYVQFVHVGLHDDDDEARERLHIKEADTANKEHSTLSEVSCLALHLAS